MTVTLDDVLGAYKVPRASIPLVTRADLFAETQRLTEEYDQIDRIVKFEDEDGAANTPNLKRRNEIWEELQKLQTEIAETSINLEFKAMGNAEWRVLLGSHPPVTEDDQEVGFNVETFPVAAIAACAAEPTMTPGEAERLLQILPHGEISRIMECIATLNTGGAVAPKFVRSSHVADPPEI